MRETVTLNREGQKRLMVLSAVGEGRLGAGEAAVGLGLSVRHVRRLLARFRQEGAAGLAHGNRGKRPYNKLDDGVSVRVIELAQSKYSGLNTQHLAELLSEREGLVLSRSTVRRVLLGAGIKSPKTRRAPQHRSRRERRAQRGVLLQIDGSPHDWLEDRGPGFCLVGAIDDATSEVPYALFRKEEDTQGYFELLRNIVAIHGIPLAVYRDRHSIFQHPEKHRESLEEQLTGEREPTQFGRLLKELGIESIPAYSPEAKGRIERLWGTFQDRLVSELRVAGAHTMAEANEVLADFLPRYNRRFTVPAAQPGSAYLPIPPGFVPEEVFCLKHQRTVGSDNVVRFNNRRLQVQPGPDRPSYARAKVTVHQGFDGRLAVYYKGQRLATTDAPPDAAQLRSNKPAADHLVKSFLRHRPWKPGPNHPWHSSGKVFHDRG
jgi:transposase